MKRFLRIVHAGWMEKALTLLTRGYFPAPGGKALVVFATVEICVVALADSALLTDTGATDVEL